MGKLLLDANISWRLGKYLTPFFDEVLHVDNAGLGNQPRDGQIYQFAQSSGYSILTKDDDFLNLAVLTPQGPKVIRLMNAQHSVKELAQHLEQAMPNLLEFLESEERVFVLRLP